MKIRPSGIAMIFAADDDWHSCLARQLENGIEKTSLPRLREKLQDALVVLREVDECFNTVTVTHKIPVGVSSEYLMQELRKTFSDDELEQPGPESVSVTVSSRGTIDYVRSLVRSELESAIRRAVYQLHPAFP